MFKRKILLSPIIGLLITVIFYSFFLPVVCFADETDQSERENVNKTYNHKNSGVIVSMGDSYSAGEGIQPFYGSRYSEGWELKDWLAHRSEGSWGGQLRLPDVGSMNSSKYPENANPHWYFVASSGAVTWNITGGQEKDYYKWDETTNGPVVDTETIDPQIDIFKETQRRQIVPDYITITMGGNDLGFVDILKTAAINDFWVDPCGLTRQLSEAVDRLSDFEIKGDSIKEVPTENSDESNELQSDDKVRERIKKIYRKIDETASIGDDHPCILVAGYPHLLNEDLLKTKKSAGDVANALNVFNPTDAYQINMAIDIYTKVLKNIVEECQDEGLRIEYVDISDFDGHEVNTADPWINGLVFNSSHLGGLGVFPMLKDQVFSGAVSAALKGVLSDEEYKKYKNEQDLMSLLVEDNVFGNLTSTAIRELLGIDYNQDLKYELICGASLHPNSKGANCYKEAFQKKINELEDLTETPPDDPIQTETRIGSEITMGNYRGEDIEWIVLDSKDDNLLVISKDIIEAKPFNNEDADVTWETCTLRKWLNEDFYQTAFSSSERERIQRTHVVTPDDPISGADGGNDTDDYIFVLSTEEARTLFASDDDRKAVPKDYLSEQELGIYEGYGHWWLRSPSSDTTRKYATKNGATVGATGVVNDWGEWITTPEGVRPAMWIDKNMKATAIVDVDPTSADKATLVRDGDVVIFGQYEQDGNTGNGKEPIEWEILTEKDGKMLLISKYILDCQPYNTESTEVTWETCSLRQWLNNDFYNTAFNESDRELIETTTLSNPDNPFGGKGGNSTDDKVFCLSMEEVYSYLDILYETDNPYGGDFCFSLDFLREVTPYARDRGVVHREIGAGYFDFTEVPVDESDLIGKDLGNWWLRSPANSNDRACVVFLSGQAGYEIEEFVHVAAEGVRPAMWVNCNDVKDPSSENTAPVPDEVKAAYLDVVNNVSYEDFKSEYYGVPSSGKFSYDLVYVDNDDIPELLVCLTVSGGLNGDEVFANLYTIGNDNKAVQLFQRWAADRFDANTVYYPRENMVREFFRSGASDCFIDVVSIDATSRQPKFSYYEQIYDVNDSSIVNYYIYDNKNHKTIAEITKLEYEALTTCPGDPVPLVAGRTLQEIKDVLK